MFHELPAVLVHGIHQFGGLRLVAHALEHPSEFEFARSVQKNRKGVGAVAKKIRRAAAYNDAGFLFGGLFDDFLDDGNQAVSVQDGQVRRRQVPVKTSAPDKVDQPLQQGVLAFLAPPAVFHRDLCEPGDFLGQRVIEQFPVQAGGKFLADVAATSAKFTVDEKDLFHNVRVPYSASDTAWTCRGLSKNNTHRTHTAQRQATT